MDIHETVMFIHIYMSTYILKEKSNLPGSIFPGCTTAGLIIFVSAAVCTVFTCIQQFNMNCFSRSIQIDFIPLHFSLCYLQGKIKVVSYFFLWVYMHRPTHVQTDKHNWLDRSIQHWYGPIEVTVVTCNDHSGMPPSRNVSQPYNTPHYAQQIQKTATLQSTVLLLAMRAQMTPGGRKWGVNF